MAMHSEIPPILYTSSNLNHKAKIEWNNNLMSFISFEKDLIERKCVP